MNGDGAKVILRYVAYIAFAGAAFFFWLFYAVHVLGIFWAPIDRFCEPNCPEPSMLRRVVEVASVWLAIPITVIVFIFYRRGVRKILGYQDD